MSSNPGKGPFVDAEPARRHCRNLMAAGVAVTRIAAASTVSTAVISRLLYACNNRPPSRHLRQQNVNLLLAVRPEDVVTGYTNATGTHRRIQALMAIGWTQLSLGPHFGCHPRYVTYMMRRPTVYGTTAINVAAAYDRLWNKDPLKHGVPLGPHNWVRNYARSNGWPPPAAWDDDQIDDPNGKPDTGEDTHLGRDELAALRRAEIEHLASYSVPEREIADRLGMSREYVHDLLRELRTGQRRDRTQKEAA